MSDQCKSCISNTECQKEPDECGAEKSLLGSLNQVKYVIAVMSGKGGVGKSSVTGLIAAELARQGKIVGILDADITGPSQPRAFGINRGIKMQASQFGMLPPETASGIKIMSVNFFLPEEDDPVVWRGPLLAGAVSQFWGEVDWRDLDYMIVDLPPGTGDVPLTVIQTLPINGMVIVSSPQELAVMVVKKNIKMAKKMQAPILGLIENMSYILCSHCGERQNIFGISQGEKVAAETGLDFLGALPWQEDLNTLIDAGKIEDFHSEAVTEIVRRIREKLET